MLMCVVVLCTSCASSKKVVYLQDVVPLKQQDIKQKYEVYVHNDDLLAIMVNSKNPELALPFNMPMVILSVGKWFDQVWRTAACAGLSGGYQWGHRFPDPRQVACGGADSFAVDRYDQATPDRRET